jgi:hypothetical protein
LIDSAPEWEINLVGSSIITEVFVSILVVLVSCLLIRVFEISGRSQSSHLGNPTKQFPEVSAFDLIFEAGHTSGINELTTVAEFVLLLLWGIKFSCSEDASRKILRGATTQPRSTDLIVVIH